MPLTAHGADHCLKDDGFFGSTVYATLHVAGSGVPTWASRIDELPGDGAGAGIVQIDSSEVTLSTTGGNRRASVGAVNWGAPSSDPSDTITPARVAYWDAATGSPNCLAYHDVSGLDELVQGREYFTQSGDLYLDLSLS